MIQSPTGCQTDIVGFAADVRVAATSTASIPA